MIQFDSSPQKRLVRKPPRPVPAAATDCVDVFLYLLRTNRRRVPPVVILM